MPPIGLTVTAGRRVSLMVAVILFAFVDRGAFLAPIERHCREHVAFRVITGNWASDLRARANVSWVRSSAACRSTSVAHRSHTSA